MNELSFSIFKIQIAAVIFHKFMEPSPTKLFILARFSC